jgi:16S rRNA (guanine527-N7)-methyltransferase
VKPAPTLRVPHAPLLPPLEFLADARSLSIEFEDRDLAALGLYLAALLEFNTTTNLTAITDPPQAWRRHILDSLTLLPFLADLPEHARVIDVGSGGGLPGIPLAITLPHLRFTLLEATAKKAEFLRAVVGFLRLSNTEVLAQRAEKAAHDRGAKHAGTRTNARRENYDAVVARAVGRLATLAELTVPFAKIGGRVLLIKGQQADEELAEARNALHTLKAVHVQTHDTPTGRLVVLEKNSATPKTYPRADGEPKRAPLSNPQERGGANNKPPK